MLSWVQGPATQGPGLAPLLGSESLFSVDGKRRVLCAKQEEASGEGVAVQNWGPGAGWAEAVTGMRPAAETSPR